MAENKIKNNSSAVRRSGFFITTRLLALLGSLSFIIVLAVINGSIGFLCSMGVTFFGAVGIAKALGENIGLSYGMIIAFCIGCGVLRGFLRYLEQYGNHYIAFRLLAVLRDKIFGVLRILCPAKLENKQKGSIISMITSDLETLEVFYAHTISPICIAVVVSAFVTIAAGKIANWYFSAAAVVSYLVLALAVPMVYSSLMKKSGVRYREQLASFSAYFLDSIKGIRETVLLGNQEKRKRKVERRTKAMLEESGKLSHDTSRLRAVTETCVSVFSLAVLFIGAFCVIRGSLSLGRAVIGVAAIFGSFGPVVAIASLPGNLAQTFASGDRVIKLLDEKPQVVPVTSGHDFDFHELKVENLSFGYDKESILRDICLHAGQGEIIGISGSSGSGKSTLLKLLLRFWTKEEGSILYDGSDIENINTESLYRNVTMVSQNTYLFDETIEYNLRIAKLDATREELEKACHMASVHDFIMSLPQGYSSRVGLLGDSLSAGERQRIGLARAFLRGSKLILLDEPTSNVDSMNEGIILKSLSTQKKDKSIILVSHRESTMSIADRVYKMDNGIIKESGRKEND